MKRSRTAIFGNPNRTRSQHYHPHQHRIIGQPKTVRAARAARAASLTSNFRARTTGKFSIDFGVDMTRPHAHVARKINVTGEPCSITAVA